MLKASPWNKLGVNIMAVHMKWDHQQVKKVMPLDTAFVSIVRDPIELFESLYTYVKMDKAYHMTVEEFALNVSIDAPRHLGYIGYNQMVWDFGIPDQKQIYNLTHVSQLVREAEEKFDLVMVAERMEESQVLLSHLLCWDLRDVIVLKLNARSSKFKKAMSEESQKVLRDKLAPDYLLYRTFVKRLDELVEDFGRKRMAREITRLRALTKQLMDTCEFTKVSSNLMTGANKPWSSMVDGYKPSAGSSKCQQFSRSELSFINFLRGLQRSEVSRRFGLPDSLGLDALPLGPQLFENPASLTNRINALKKMLVYKENAAKESGVSGPSTIATVETAALGEK
ncbi:Galactose-3-O-sulfotransferase 3-like [Homarus americanus]|uniref:Galactose-3-O-sulfotransferase 3-like n=2 Tax=Homarus americanus TaxID=6706 RepID=A0A8J5J9U3_HOMAM|nr:Galactose-3-O-sulfotransferase 3-like [Homarus americanus]